jgi:hypothetical protein
VPVTDIFQEPEGSGEAGLSLSQGANLFGI